MRFNSSKLLIDPYAKAISGRINWADEMFGYVVGGEAEDMARDFRDDAWGMPKAVVIDNAFDWGDDQAPRIPLHSTIIYEMHTKGFTKLNDKIPEEMRGTYAGVGQRGFDRLLKRARRDGGRAAAGASPRQRQGAGRSRPDELLGLQHDRVLRAGPEIFLAPARPAGR